MVLIWNLTFICIIHIIPIKLRVFSEIRDIYCIILYMKGKEFYRFNAILFTKKQYTNNNPYIFRKLGKYLGFLWDYWRSILFVWYFAFIFLVHKFRMKTRFFSEMSGHLLYINGIWIVWKIIVLIPYFSRKNSVPIRTRVFTEKSGHLLYITFYKLFGLS
jgi:hypothetical protein